MLALLPALCSFAQEGQRDSLVRLVKATSVQLIEKYGLKYRKAVDATFLHNGTYLICDTALWNVDSKVINSEGHVQIIQDETLLTSDRLDYYIDRDLAEFRGGVVQLTDKDRNTLRTRNLDYNTKDSIAIFRHGGSMRDKDGQIIESDNGTYDSKSSEFDFSSNVNMFTDSVFVKTDRLLYEGNSSKAWFNSKIDFWKDGNMLSADRGWYERDREMFFFTGSVHGMSKEQESWSDTLYFHRASNEVRMLGNAQIQDTTRNVTAVADYILYQDSISRVTLSRNAAVALRTDQGERPDTIYFGADTLIYQTFRKCDIPEEEIKVADERLADMNTDPVREYRTKAAREAAAAAEEEAMNNPNDPRNWQKKKKAAESAAEEKADMGADSREERADAPEPQDNEQDSAREETDGDSQAAADTLNAVDTLASGTADSSAEASALAGDLSGEDGIEAPSDSLAAPADSLAAIADSLAALPPPDTTKIGFLSGIGKVKVFREDIQVRCDSMRYCDLDSIARFYIDPVVWNDGNRQYTSDSLFVLVRNGRADRASLLSEAFIITQEDSLCFDQIKATEVMAYFDSTAALKRFDALGGASALFYLQENDVFATVNKVESKMLSAFFLEGQLDRVFYFEQPHNDAYPVVQLPREERRMKGFDWRPDEKPRGKRDITDLDVKPSQRTAYEARPKASFKQTDIYFPGYMKSVYEGIALRDSLKKVPRPQRPVLTDEPEEETPADTLAAAPADSLETGAAADSLAASQPADSLAAAPGDGVSVSDTSAVVTAPQEQKSGKEIKRAEREAKAEARRAAREARWAELDARDAEREAARQEKAKLRRRATMRRVLAVRDAQQARDDAKFEKYKARYEKRKARQDARKSKKIKNNVGEQEPAPSGERAPAPFEGGEIPAPVAK